MTWFNIEIPDDFDTAYVTVDRRFDIAITRTPRGLDIRVYPITNGKIWDDPYKRVTVDEEEIITLEREMEE